MAKSFYSSLLLFTVIFIFISCRSKDERLNYPPAQKSDIVDDYHGTKIADPYRWLENPDDSATQAWVESQNKLTFDYIRNSDSYGKIKERLTEIWDYPKYSAPSKNGNRYFFLKNEGLQNQSVLYMKGTLDGQEQVLLDPNKLSEDGTVALSGISYSEDGRYLAYATSSAGSDRQLYRIKEIENGKDLEDIINWCKFTSIAWKHDNSGFFYNRFPEPGTVAKEDENNYNRLYWHKLGTAQSQDKLIYEDPMDKELGFSPVVSPDGNYLLLYVWKGTDPRNRIYYREISSNKPFIRLLDKADANYEPLHNEKNIFYFKTDFNAPRGKVIAIDIMNPDSQNWKDIIPESQDVIDYVTVVNNKLIIAYMRDAQHRLQIFNLRGDFEKEISLPSIGTVAGITGKSRDTEMFFTFTSFVYPPTIMRYEFSSSEISEFQKAEVKFDPGKYETKQVFFNSKDGTRVPMFITHKKGLELNGDNPAILYGYGGFNISLTPSFSVSRIIWLENGGVFALANLRGGNEYGEEWHKAGMLEKKQNVFDDFTSAAQWLIDNNYTRSERLAIQGGSNGGLLVAAAMTQKPGLFGAVICQVPVIDMLRYHKFTVGRYWIPEYGNAEENPDHFRFMIGYSPLHNIRENTEYPPTLITSADTDDRVVPAHSKKFAATLQEIYKGTNPILLRVETKAGHGAGKPTMKIIEEISDIYGFLFKRFSMSL